MPNGMECAAVGARLGKQDCIAHISPTARQQPIGSGRLICVFRLFFHRFYGKYFVLYFRNSRKNLEWKLSSDPPLSSPRDHRSICLLSSTPRPSPPPDLLFRPGSAFSTIPLPLIAGLWVVSAAHLFPTERITRTRIACCTLQLQSDPLPPSTTRVVQNDNKNRPGRGSTLIGPRRDPARLGTGWSQHWAAARCRPMLPEACIRATTQIPV